MGTIVGSIGLVAAEKTSTGATIVGWIILIALVAGAVWGVRVLARRWKASHGLSPEERARRQAKREADARAKQAEREADARTKQAMRDHKRAVHQADDAEKSATRDYDKAVGVADKGVKKATREYDRRINQVRKRLEAAKMPEKLAAFPAITLDSAQRLVLHDDHIKTASGSHPLTPTVAAAVDTAGNLVKWQKSRSTLTRMGAGTLIAGPLGFLVGAAAKKSSTHKEDNRELYLIVEGEDWGDTRKCDPKKDGERARNFAQAVTVAARNVERVKADRERLVKKLTEELAAVEADRSGIEAAERTRAAVEADRSGIEAAERTRAAVEADRSGIEAAERSRAAVGDGSTPAPPDGDGGGSRSSE
jgi:hypothetical protein